MLAKIYIYTNSNSGSSLRLGSAASGACFQSNYPTNRTPHYYGQQLCRPININAAGVESHVRIEWPVEWVRGHRLHFMHKLFMKFIVLNGQR